MKKEEFKEFARKNPILAKKVISGKTTWQKLYELYDIYGENTSIWNNLESELEKKTTLRDIITTISALDVESLQKGISGLEKAIGLLQNIGDKNSTEEPKDLPKPIYKSFED